MSYGSTGSKGTFGLCTSVGRWSLPVVRMKSTMVRFALYLKCSSPDVLYVTCDAGNRCVSPLAAALMQHVRRDTICCASAAAFSRVTWSAKLCVPAVLLAEVSSRMYMTSGASVQSLCPLNCVTLWTIKGTPSLYPSPPAKWSFGTSFDQYVSPPFSPLLPTPPPMRPDAGIAATKWVSCHTMMRLLRDVCFVQSSDTFETSLHRPGSL